MHKQILRNKYLQLRKQLSAEKINDLSQQICEKFLLFVSQNLQHWQQQRIALYYATQYEVSTIFLQQYLQKNNLT